MQPELSFIKGLAYPVTSNASLAVVFVKSYLISNIVSKFIASTPFGHREPIKAVVVVLLHVAETLVVEIEPAT
jgi:hypothetical protein